MSKFWTFVSLLVLTASVLLLTADDVEDPEIMFSDLETECRYDRGESFDIDLERDDSMSFSGVFPVESPRATLDHSYWQSRDRISLNIEVVESEPVTNFTGACLGSVVYDAKTQSLEPGLYTLDLRHDNVLVERQVIRVK